MHTHAHKHTSSSISSSSSSNSNKSSTVCAHTHTYTQTWASYTLHHTNMSRRESELYITLFSSWNRVHCTSICVAFAVPHTYFINLFLSIPAYHSALGYTTVCIHQSIASECVACEKLAKLNTFCRMRSESHRILLNGKNLFRLFEMHKHTHTPISSAGALIAHDNDDLFVSLLLQLTRFKRARSLVRSLSHSSTSTSSSSSVYVW